MGMMDNLKQPVQGGYTEGVRELIIENIETKFTSGGKEYKYITFLFANDSEKHVSKKIWDDDYAGRKLAEIVQSVGIEPSELFEACKQGQGDEWMHTKLPGRRGRFDCRKGRPNQDGKQYLEPMTPSEIEYMEWKERQNNSPRAPAPSVPSSPSIQSADGFMDDQIPF